MAKTSFRYHTCSYSGSFLLRTYYAYCCWKKHPAPVDTDNLPFIYRVLYIPSGAGFLPSTVPLFCWCPWPCSWNGNPLKQLRFSLDGMVSYVVCLFFCLLVGLVWFGLVWFGLVCLFVLFCFVLFCFVLFCFVYFFYRTEIQTFHMVDSVTQAASTDSLKNWTGPYQQTPRKIARATPFWSCIE